MVKQAAQNATKKKGAVKKKKTVTKAKQKKEQVHHHAPSSSSPPLIRSKFVGVSWCKQKKKWKAQIKIDGKKKFLGYFSSAAEASLAYARWLGPRRCAAARRFAYSTITGSISTIWLASLLLSVFVVRERVRKAVLDVLDRGTREAIVSVPVRILVLHVDDEAHLPVQHVAVVDALLALEFDAEQFRRLAQVPALVASVDVLVDAAP